MKFYWMYPFLLTSLCTSYFHGINWFGMETDHQCLGGLWKHSIQWYLEGLSSQGWNALRIPLCAQSLLENPLIPSSLLIGDPYLFSQDIHYLSLLDSLFEISISYSFQIILDIHRLKPALSTPLWYIPNDSFWTHYRLWDVYDLLLERYQHYPHFIGLDLFNEPHYMATFGDNNISTDWRLFTQESILYLRNTHSCVNIKFLINGIDWGKNLTFVSNHPSSFSESFIRWSPHLYGPSLNYIPSYDSSDLFSYWDSLFGNITDPSSIWIGEWGGRFNESKDHLWLSIFWEYFQYKNFSGHFFWALNPDSKDVDGLLSLSWDEWNPLVISFFHPYSSHTV